MKRNAVTLTFSFGRRPLTRVCSLHELVDPLLSVGDMRWFDEDADLGVVEVATVGALLDERVNVELASSGRGLRLRLAERGDGGGPSGRRVARERGTRRAGRRGGWWCCRWWAETSAKEQADGRGEELFRR